MKPRDLTIVMAYYENASMLERQLDAFAALPEILRRRLAYIVVDDGSPDHPARGREIGMRLEIYRIGVDVRWNQDAARNIGAHHAQTDWLLLTDMDHMMPEATLERITVGPLEKRRAYKFARVSEPEMLAYKPHPNSWLMTRALYNAAGGYDERFAGLYGTDGDFRNRIDEIAEIEMLDCPLVRVPREVTHDASTPPTLLSRKTPEDRDGLDRVKHERAALRDWRPLRLTFPYVRVWPVSQSSAE